MSNLEHWDRRNFLYTLGATLLASPLLSLSGCSSAPERRVVRKDKLGVALVGLGKYSSTQLAPALLETHNCYLAGIVTGTPAKAEAWKKQYEIPEKNIYNYENFDEIAKNKDIDVVYIVLPNSMHAEYTIRAAKAGKHIICEKPMATTVEDAQRMIDACKENNVLLAVGYRLHYEPFHLRVMRIGQDKVFGKVKRIEARNSSDHTKGSPDEWRLKKDLAGGGPLMDLGIYCVQGAIYTLGKNPVSVTARFGEVTNSKFFSEVEESISWTMEFPEGVIAECNSSYAVEENLLSGTAETGWWEVSPAYAYEGKAGKTSQGKMDLPNIFEQVKQLEAQVEGFMFNRPPETSGEMGLRDVRILMSIYESARNNGKKINL